MAKWQETLQIQSHVTFGSGFAPPVLGPIHTAGHQLNGGAVDDVNHSFESEGKAGAPPPAELRSHPLQFGQHFPKQRFGHRRVALPVGVREGVLAGRCRPANRRKRPRVQPQCVAHVVQSQSMGQLGIDQADHMTPGLEGAALGLRVVLARQSRHQMVGNQIAQLPQQRKAAARWLAVGFLLHALPCGRSPSCKPTSFSTSLRSPINPVGQL